MRDLVPQELLGQYYTCRLAMMTAVVVVFGLGGSFFVGSWSSISSPDQTIYGFSILLIGGWITFGLLGPSLVLGAKEPLMPPTQESGRSAFAILAEPLRDHNFSKLVRFLFLWGFSLNLAGPFFAVYMLTRLGLPLPVVIGFTVISQITNILFVRVWGALADRAGSKRVLSLSASLFLLVIIGWVFTNNPGRYFLTLPLPGVLHVFADVVAADVTLTVDTLTLKSAPAGKATPYLGIAGIATGLGGGLGPIVGGLLADFFSVRTFRLDLSWASPNGVVELPALTLYGFDFLFAISFVPGLLSLNLLAALREQGEMPGDVALSQLTVGMDPIMRVVSSVPGVNAASAVSYGYLKRLPGADVALGVMAYQLASSTPATVASVDRGRVLATDVERRVANASEETIGETEDVAGHGLELARHATRGAIHIGDDLAEQMGRVARGAVLGTLRTLGGNRFSPLDSLRGAGYGAVQGAVESGQDPATAAAAAIGAAREAARELGVSSHEAAAAMAEGVVTAAEAAGEETLRAVRDSLPVELAQAERFDTLVEDSQQ